MRMLAIAGALLLLAGCSDGESVDFYQSHDAEREAKLRDCVTGFMQIDRSDQACANAAKAQDALNAEKLHRVGESGDASIQEGKAVIDKAVRDAMNDARANSGK